MEIGLSLGSNMGDRLARLREASRRIAAIPGVSITAQSPVYETAPVGVSAEHRHIAFLNAVLIVESGADVAWLSERLHRIEDEMGRVRGPDRNSPRPIDIDIIFAGGIGSSDQKLTLPHPRWAERRFVVQPLADVRPQLRLPGEARSVAEILAALPETEAVAVFAPEW